MTKKTKNAPRWIDVKRIITGFDKKQLVELVGDLYRLSMANKDFFHARFSLGEDPLEPYKRIIQNAIHPYREDNEILDITSATEAIRHYSKAVDNVKGEAELMTFFVECGNNFTLSYGDIDRESGVIRVVINPYFLEMYAESFVTNIDLKFRVGLKSDVSKALYRFFQGQMGTDISIEMIRLAAAVNLTKALEKTTLRTRIRGVLRELETKGYLKSFEITDDEVVHIKKAAETAVNIGRQILGSEKFDISQIRGPMGDA